MLGKGICVNVLGYLAYTLNRKEHGIGAIVQKQVNNR